MWWPHLYIKCSVSVPKYLILVHLALEQKTQDVGARDTLALTHEEASVFLRRSQDLLSLESTDASVMEARLGKHSNCCHPKTQAIKGNYKVGN